MPIENVRGSLPAIIRNDDNLYRGNLVAYFQHLFFHAQNLDRPYHNFRHMTHVLWLCHDACRFYRRELTPVAMRKLLVAALFHDFDHAGMLGFDGLNIERAILNLNANVLAEDRPFAEDIANIIRATEFPYRVKTEALDSCARILRDADACQALSPAWIQQVIFGLSAEWRKTPLQLLKAQEPFLKHLAFGTIWARVRFPQSAIDAKIAEVRELLELLEPEKAAVIA